MGNNFFKKLKSANWLRFTIGISFNVVLYVILSNLPDVVSAVSSFLGLLSPLIYGIVFAYLLTPLVNFLYEKAFYKIKKENLRLQLSNIAAIVIVFLVILWMMSGFIPQIAESITSFFANLGTYTETAQEALRYIINLADRYNIDLDMLDAPSSDLLQSVVNFLTDNVTRIAHGSINFTSNAIDLGLGFILMLYFLIYKPVLVKSYYRLMRAILSKETYPNVTNFLSKCNEITKTYIVSDIFDGLIILVVTLIFMTILNMPYSIVISLLVGVTNLLPTIGPFIGGIGGAVVLFFASPHSVIPFIIFIIILQQIDGYVIKPRLFGGALGISGVWITVAIVTGAKLFGIIGIIIATPFVAILQLILNRWLEKKEAEGYSSAGG